MYSIQAFYLYHADNIGVAITAQSRCSRYETESRLSTRGEGGTGQGPIRSGKIEDGEGLGLRLASKWRS